MPAQTRTYYEILGVDKKASIEEITQAYRKLAKSHHPDKVPETEKKEATEKFVEILAAYEILNDEKRRARYDHGGNSTYRNRKTNQPQQTYHNKYDELLEELSKNDDHDFLYEVLPFDIILSKHWKTTQIYNEGTQTFEQAQKMSMKYLTPAAVTKLQIWLKNNGVEDNIYLKFNSNCESEIVIIGEKAVNEFVIAKQWAQYVAKNFGRDLDTEYETIPNIKMAADLVKAMQNNDVEKIEDIFNNTSSDKRNMHGNTIFDISDNMLVENQDQLDKHRQMKSALNNIVEKNITLLMRAVQSSDMENVQQHLEVKGINIQDVYGNTPLHEAIKNGDHEIVRLLLENGARLDIQNAKGNNPFHSAAQNLRELHEKIHEKKASEAEKNKVEIAKKIIKNILEKSEPSLVLKQRNKLGESVFETFMKNNLTPFDDLDLVKKMVEKSGGIKDVLINTNDKRILNILYHIIDRHRSHFNLTQQYEEALRGDDDQLIEKFQNAGAITEIEQIIREIEYSKNSEAEIIEKLRNTLDNNQNADINQHLYDTILTASIKKGYVNLVEFAIQTGANVDMPDTSAFTRSSRDVPLTHAVQAKNLQIIELLFDHGADPSLALIPIIHEAVRTKDNKILELILSHKNSHNIDINATHSYGSTAALYCAENNQIDMLRTLVFEHHADIHIKNRDNSTVLNVSAHSSNNHIIYNMICAIPKLSRSYITDFSTNELTSVTHHPQFKFDHSTFEELIDYKKYIDHRNELYEFNGRKGKEENTVFNEESKSKIAVIDRYILEHQFEDVPENAELMKYQGKILDIAINDITKDICKSAKKLPTEQEFIESMKDKLKERGLVPQSQNTNITKICKELHKDLIELNKKPEGRFKKIIHAIKKFFTSIGELFTGPKRDKLVKASMNMIKDIVSVEMIKSDSKNQDKMNNGKVPIPDSPPRTPIGQTGLAKTQHL